MANFARRIVSGNKARFRDDELDLELDLVYVTDNVIIMGYPADGMEAFYRNSRHDARKFLEHRHQQNYWIFNFCPLTENSYPADFFHGHVSRYPFPDHHAPPLAIMTLAAREMAIWLDQSPNNVVVLHCKAGKGRSGTLACSYLLTLEEVPKGPKLERSHTRKEWANKRAAEMIAAVTSVSEADASEDDIRAEETASPPLQAEPLVGTTLSPNEEGITRVGREDSGKGNILPGDTVKIEQDAMSPSASSSQVTDGPISHSPVAGSPASSRAASRAPTSLPAGYSNSAAANSTSSLDSVLALHSARRMKPPSKDDTRKTPRTGVSIPSQRRFLFYWSQILSGASPKGFWELSPSTNEILHGPQQKVRVRGITIQMIDPGTTKQTALKVVNKILSKTTGGKFQGKTQSTTGDIWVSLARYDDELVNTLETWEKHTRDPKKMGRRRPGSDTMSDPVAAGGEQGIAKLFEDGKWDSGKMVRSFARVGALDKSDVYTTHDGEEKIVTHNLHPLPSSSWINVSTKKPRKTSRKSTEGEDDTDAATDDSVSTVSARGEANLASEEVENGEIILDANREVRAKLYLGSVPMGWFWFVPTFHMSQGELDPVHLKLKRKDVDFPLGAGSWIVEIDVEMEWVRDEAKLKAPASQTAPNGSLPEEPAHSGVAAVEGLVEGGRSDAADAAEAVKD